MTGPLPVAVQLLPGARMPLRASGEAAGYDLFAYEDVVIRPGETVLVSTGIRMALPPSYEAQVRPRSGLSLRTRLRIANAPGTIDSDYRGLVCVICENTNSLLDPLPILLGREDLLENFHEAYRPVSLADYLGPGRASLLPPDLIGRILYLDRQDCPLGTLFIRAGERIAQMVFSKIESAEFILLEEIESLGRDRGGGFGSTGML